ncbi:PPC domain-containing protein, partial [Puniceicoccaceae bacterium K14]|nr:PPC domain-containing protein [Puniceicoccaceae bacterium K14]
YRFEVTELSRFDATLSGVLEDSYLYLGFDEDGDGVWDSGETMESSTSTGIADKTLTETLVSGVYFLQVTRRGLAYNTSYTLDMGITALTQPTTLSDPGTYSDLSGAYDLGVLGLVPLSVIESVGSNDAYDVYRFSVERIVDIDISVAGVSEDADLYLGFDDNGDGVWSGDTITSSTQSGDDQISYVLVPGEYFIGVQRDGFASNTTYTLEVDAPDLDDSDNANPALISGTSVSTSYEVGDADVYWYDAAEGDTLIVDLSEVDSSYDPWLQVYAPDGSRLYNEVAYASQSSAVTAVSAGRYYVVVREWGSNGSGDYKVLLSRVPGEQNADDEGSLLISGQAETSNFSLGDTDVYWYDAVEGDTLIVDLSEVDSTYDPWLQIYGPDGSRLYSEATYTSLSSTLSAV